MKFFVNQIGRLPQIPGIYKFYSKTNILLYIGKAKNLKNRVSSYFQNNLLDFKSKQLVEQIHHIEITLVSSEFETLLLEAKLIKDAQPKYNVIWKDDKQYIYIKITKEKFPRVLFARKTEGAADFFGPFPSSTIVREILSYLRTIFPFCTQKESGKRVCFYNHLGLCNPCPSEIVKTSGKKYQKLAFEYRQSIRHIKQILEGKVAKIKKHLVYEMETLSQTQNYEEAAIYRDRLSQFDYLINNYTPVASYLGDPKFLTKVRLKEQTELIDILKPYYPKLSKLVHLECYDISNISGKLATGSMVTFRHGEPDKNLYRRFRIRMKNTPDDFGMLREMITRRLTHTEWRLPDLFVIDGGKPQLSAVKKVLGKLETEIPFIGLSKVYEEIVIPTRESFDKIRLPDNSPSLNLVKRLRDEAHRFAHSYHALLRIKYLLSSVEKK